MKIKTFSWKAFSFIQKILFIVFFIFCMTLFSSDASAAPTYSLNSTNSTLTGTSVLHSLNWTDASGLSGYIFSFDNCTGDLTNSTWISFSGTWSNVTKIINSTVDCIIRWCVYANDTTDDWNSTSCNNSFSYATSQLGYLEVNLTNPDTSEILNVIQNLTFNINATVTCINGSCGNVFGTALYNLSSSPDTAISITKGDKPFYVQENPANVEKSCGILNDGDSCQLNWTVNATGDVNTGWKIGVMFNSSYTGIQSNNTNSATVSIIPCTEDFTLQWNSINFGLLNPSTGPNSAPGNSDNQYNITVNSGSCNLDFYIKGTNLVNTTLNSQIGIGNFTWSNSSNSYSESFNLSSNLTALKMNVTQGVSFTTWYWINVPPVYSGYYNGNIYIFGVENGKSPA
jgi:hypothetical protein